MTSSKVENYLSEQMNNSDQTVVAEGFQTLSNLYSNKLWSQLSAETKKLMRENEFVRLVDLCKFYEEFVKDFERRIEPLNLVELITPIAEYKFKRDKQEAFRFLDSFDKLVEKDNRARVRLQSSKIQLRLIDKAPNEEIKCRDLQLVRQLLEETKVKLDELVDVGPVHAAYYKCSAEYQRQMGDHKRYYEEALHYLGCEDVGRNLNTEQKHREAVLLSVAALLGVGVYNFGELLAHPILNALNGTPKEWLRGVLDSVNAGDWEDFQKHKSQLIKEFPETEKAMSELEQKLRLLCLMEMAHRLPAQRRNLRFGDIARAVRVSEDDVELLVMKALANRLIDARIDEPARMVNVSWVQPRVLSAQQTKELADRTGKWRDTIGGLQEELQINARDLNV